MIDLTIRNINIRKIEMIEYYNITIKHQNIRIIVSGGRWGILVWNDSNMKIWIQINNSCTVTRKNRYVNINE